MKQCVCDHYGPSHPEGGACNALVLGRRCPCVRFREVMTEELEFDRQSRRMIILYDWPPENELIH